MKQKLLSILSILSILAVMLTLIPTQSFANTGSDGFYVYLYGVDKAILDETYIDLELFDADENLLAKTRVDKNDYVSENKHLAKFDDVRPVEGQKYLLLVRTMSSNIEKITVDLQTELKANQYAEIDVVSYADYEDGPTFLVGTKDAPVRLSASLIYNKATVKIVDTNSQAVKDEKITITDTMTGQSKEYVTDKNGEVIFNVVDYNRILQVKGDGILESKQLSLFDGYATILATKTQGDVLVANSGVGRLELKYNLEKGINYDLSVYWSNADINLKKVDKTVQKLQYLNLNNNIVDVMSGDYTLEFTSDTADIKTKNKNISIIDGQTTTLNVDIKSKSTLRVDGLKGATYRFLDATKEDMVKDAKTYKVDDKISFAVAKGDTYMVQDVETGNVDTVMISADGETILVLGKGTMLSQDKRGVHTGDDFWMALVLILLALSVITLYLLDKYEFINIKKLFSLFMLGLILTSSIATTDVHADTGGSVGGNIGGGSSAKVGQMQFYNDDTAMLKVTMGTTSESFINAQEKSGGLTVAEMQTMFGVAAYNTASDAGMYEISKQKDNYKHMGVYVAPSANAASRWRDGSYQVWGKDNLVDFYNGSQSIVLVGKAYKFDNGVKDRLTIDNARGDAFTSFILGSIQGKNLRVDDYGNEINKRFHALDKAQAKKVLEDYYHLYVKGLTNDELSLDTTGIDTQNIVMYVETLMGYRPYGTNSDSRFVSLRDYIKAENYIRGTSLDVWREGEATKQTKSCAGLKNSKGQTCTNAACKSLGHMRFSGKAATDQYVKTLRPISIFLSNDMSNPYGAWGFLTLEGIKSTESPGLMVKANLKVLDDNDDVIATTSTFIGGWGEADVANHPLTKMTIPDKNIFKIDKLNTFTIDGVTYEIMQGKVPAKIYDNKDNQEIDAGEGILDSESLRIKLGDEDTKYKPQFVGEFLNSVEKDIDITNPLLINGKPKYFGQTNSDGTGVYSHARLELDLFARVAEPKESGFKVEEWRLAKYWPTVVQDDGEAYAGYEIEIQESDANSHKKPFLSPSGSVRFNLVDPAVPSWMRSRALSFDDLVRSITLSSTVASIPVYGDLWVVRENDDIDNIRTAGWVNTLDLKDVGINSTFKGQLGKQAELKKNHMLQFGIDNPNSYTAGRAVYKHSTYHCSSDGCGGHDKCECYIVQYTPGESYTTADYDTNIKFERYLGNDTTASDVKGIDSKANGKFTIAAKSPISLWVNPEVPMLYDSPTGNKAITTVAGDRLREIKPLSFHTYLYEAGVEQKVVGTSVATDAKAKTLASSLGASGKQVIHKGSGANVSFDVDGKFIVSSFVLDLPDSVKNSWNPGTTYSATNIRDAFISKVATKDATGKWVVDAKGYENLKISNKDFGVIEQNVKYPETATNEITHYLVVRGGKLLSVDGDKNYKTTLPTSNPKLWEALVGMGLTDDTDNVFGSFVRNGGKKLDEVIFANLGNVLRGASDLAKGKGWYVEDTTQLVVREYVTEFKLPHAMFPDKLPMTVNGLNSPMDKNQFYSQGATGHTKLKFSVMTKGSMNPYETTPGTPVDVYMMHDSSVDGQYGNKTTDYIVPNVSVLDTNY